MLKDWDKLPKYMQNDAVRPYYDELMKKQGALKVKRAFDFIMALIMLIILAPVLVIIAILIVKDSEGGVFYRQERITQYGRKFRIFKFRTMVADADKKGSLVTTGGDARITKIGAKLRGCRLDELPQLINILLGDMSFVGTRPEVTKYVKRYTPEMMATLLLPAGVTSECSIKYKDEDRLLSAADDVDEVYVNQVLPGKMEYNLEAIKKFSNANDLKTMVKTVFAVLK
ncbi:MAG: sugar transferase [Lachnospiraceae bacterium]|nr:sugar transferase [Lachnospiraceae bacterium]